eukprot:223813-Chlamydomonas_euryale.AAC.1
MHSHPRPTQHTAPSGRAALEAVALPPPPCCHAAAPSAEHGAAQPLPPQPSYHSRCRRCRRRRR